MFSRVFTLTVATLLVAANAAPNAEITAAPVARYVEVDLEGRQSMYAQAHPMIRDD